MFKAAAYLVFGGFRGLQELATGDPLLAKSRVSRFRGLGFKGFRVRLELGSGTFRSDTLQVCVPRSLRANLHANKPRNPVLPGKSSYHAPLN